jgi:hypothetical protein
MCCAVAITSTTVISVNDDHLGTTGEHSKYRIVALQIDLPGKYSSGREITTTHHCACLLCLASMSC